MAADNSSTSFPDQEGIKTRLHFVFDPRPASTSFPDQEGIKTWKIQPCAGTGPQLVSLIKKGLRHCRSSGMTNMAPSTSFPDQEGIKTTLICHTSPHGPQLVSLIKKGLRRATAAFSAQRPQLVSLIKKGLRLLDFLLLAAHVLN